MGREKVEEGKGECVMPGIKLSTCVRNYVVSKLPSPLSYLESIFFLFFLFLEFSKWWLGAWGPLLEILSQPGCLVQGPNHAMLLGFCGIEDYPYYISNV